MRNCLFILLIFLAGKVCAAEKVSGQIIRNGSKTNVTFIIPFYDGRPDYLKLQFKIKYVDSQGDKIIVEPNEADEIQFQWGGQTVRLLSRYISGVSGERNMFLKLEIEGRLSMFTYCYNVQGGTIQMRICEIALQKGKEGAFKPGEIGKRLTDDFFRYQLESYLRDCPEIVEKLKRGEFKTGQYSAVVTYYNQHCGE